MRVTLIVTILSLLFTTTVYTQDIQQNRPSLKTPTIVFAGAAAADWITTYDVLQRGGRESNPMFSWIQRPTAVVTAGVASDVVGLWTWNRYVGRKHPKLATVGLFAMSSFRIWLAIHNHGLCRAPRTCSAK